MSNLNDPSLKKVIITVDDEGHCAIHAPVDFGYEDVLDILHSALEATLERATADDESRLEAAEAQKSCPGAFPQLLKSKKEYLN